MTNTTNPTTTAASIGLLLASRRTVEPKSQQERDANFLITMLAEGIEQLLPGTWSAYSAEVVRTSY